MEENRFLKGNIWKFYVFDMLGAMLFAIPVIVLFWQENGLSITQVMLLQSFFAILILILEIPTGYFADLYGRKKTMILSGIGIFFGTFVYSIGNNFLSFLVAETFFALGISFYSGTSSALIYDTLIDLKKEQSYNKYWGKAKFYGLIAMGLSNILGGFVGKFNLRWTFYISIPFMFLLIPLSFTFKEPTRHKILIEKGYLHKLIEIIKTTLFDNQKLKWILIYEAIIVSFTHAALWLYQPYLIFTGVNIFYFGLIFALFNVFTAIISKYAYKIEKKLGARNSLIILFVILGISYLLMSKIIVIFSFLFILLQQFVRGFSEPVLSDYINKLTKSDVRATVLSIGSMFGNFIYALIIPIIGWITDVYSITQALMVTGISTFIVGIIILLFLHKDRII